MKEIKIRLTDELKDRLKKTAKKQLRSATGQATAYILIGLEQDEAGIEQEAPRG